MATFALPEGGNIEETGNFVEITTMSQEEAVKHWATSCNISADAVDKLFEDGFTSINAIKLIDAEDLAKSKLPRGQKKLILSSVKMLKGERGGDTNEPDDASSDPQVPLQTSGAPQTSATVGMRAHIPADQSTSSTIQDGSAQGSGDNNNDLYTQGLLNQLRKGQLQARNGNSSDINVRQPILNDLGISLSGVVDTPAGGANSFGQTQSWKDPQIYLASAANGKSAPTYYDITDFVSGNVEEEIVVGGSGSHQVVLKSGPRKPKLDNVSLSQWIVANLAILYKLQGESKLTVEGLLDYLSYTTKICQLVQRYSLTSVLLYDREYRKLQSAHGFRWGTDVPHLQSVYLQSRGPRPTHPIQKGHGTPSSKSQPTPLTLDGKIICKLFNSKNGCHFKDCKYVHQCFHPGCHQAHSAVSHFQAKN